MASFTLEFVLQDIAPGWTVAEPAFGAAVGAAADGDNVEDDDSEDVSLGSSLTVTGSCSDRGQVLKKQSTHIRVF